MTVTDNLTIEQRLAGLEAKVALLEKERPGRRMKPNMVSEKGVCGLKPDRDSATCPDASIYRFQQGCMGTECDRINTQYYKDYRAKNRLMKEVQVELPTAIDDAAIPETPV